MIKLEGITKSFGSLQVLKGIDLEINKGEIVSIVGPSGAGKTTLLQIMGTLDEPDAGNVQIDGTVVSRMKEKELSAFLRLSQEYLRKRQTNMLLEYSILWDWQSVLPINRMSCREERNNALLWRVL